MYIIGFCLVCAFIWWIIDKIEKRILGIKPHKINKALSTNWRRR